LLWECLCEEFWGRGWVVDDRLYNVKYTSCERGNQQDVDKQEIIVSVVNFSLPLIYEKKS